MANTTNNAGTTVNAAKLSQLSKMWKGAVPTQGGFSVIPDGNYTAQLKEMKLGESKAKRVQVVSTYEIVDGEFEGKTVKRFDGLDNETSMGFFKGLCEVIGLEVPEDIGFLQDAMDEFVGGNNDLFDITVKTTKSKEGKEYSNLFVNGVSELTLTAEGEEEVTEEETVEEEVSEEEVSEEGEEEVVNEEEVEFEEEAEQEVQAPIKKFAKPVAKAPVKAVAKPVAKVATKTVAAKPTVKKITAKR